VAERFKTSLFLNLGVVVLACVCLKFNNGPEISSDAIPTLATPCRRPHVCMTGSIPSPLNSAAAQKHVVMFQVQILLRYSVGKILDMLLSNCPGEAEGTPLNDDGVIIAKVASLL
jgi:hypothetical protein